MTDTIDRRRPDWSPFATPLPPPGRDVRRLLRPTEDKEGFEHLADADKERLLRVASLCLGKDAAAKHASSRLAGCQRGTRCLSPGCPVCVGRLRIWLVGEMLALWPIGAPPPRDLAFVTLVHEQWLLPPDAIGRLTPRRLVDRVRHQFLRAGLAGVTAVGAVHGTFDQTREHWQPHVHLVVEGASRDALARLRKRHYRRTGSVYRPMLVQPVNDAVRQFSYVLKSYWPMSFQFTDETGAKRRGYRRINEPHHAHLLAALDRFTLSDSLLLLGVRRYGHELRRIDAVTDAHDAGRFQSASLPAEGPSGRVGSR